MNYEVTSKFKKSYLVKREITNGPDIILKIRLIDRGLEAYKKIK